MKANIRAKYNTIKLTSSNMIIIKLITTEDEETELKYTLKRKEKRKRFIPYQQNHHCLKKFRSNTKHTLSHTKSINSTKLNSVSI